MSNPFSIHFDCPLKIEDVVVTFNGGEPIVLKNHTITEVDIEPGKYTVHAIYSIDCGGNPMEMDKTLEAYIEKGFDYDAKVCMILKIFSLLKRYGSTPTACC